MEEDDMLARIRKAGEDMIRILAWLHLLLG